MIGGDGSNTSTKKKFLDVPRVSGFVIRLWTNLEETEGYMAIEDYPITFDPQKEIPIIQEILRKKFPQGLNETFVNETLPKFITRKITFFEQLVAQGIPPVPGQDMILEFKVQPATGKYVIRSDGTCDFKNPDLVRSVEAGEVIVVKYPPVPGKPGLSVLGKILNPPNVLDINLINGKNVVKEEDDNGVVTLKATNHGKVVFLQGFNSLSVQVTPVFVVSGDVDYSTGNIFFKGSVEIGGSVLSGFSVVATGNVIIHGVIEAGAKVTAGGDLIVYKGILGSGESDKKGEVKAFGNLSATYAENANIVAEGDITLKSAMNSQIRTNGNLFVEKSLFGGEAVSYKSMFFGELGNAMGIKTLVRAGISHTTFNRLNLMIKVVEDLKKQLEKLDKDISFVRKMGDSIPNNKREELARILQEKANNIREQIMKLEMKKADAAIELLMENRATISANVFHPGVMLFIRSSKFIVDQEFRMTTFYQKLPQETIEFTAYKPDWKGRAKTEGRKFSGSKR